MKRAALAGTLLALAAPAAAQAPQQARMPPQEAAQLATAAGLTQRGATVLNACGRPVQPRFAFADLNGDRAPEAVVAEVDPACHGGTGEKVSILWRDTAGRWNLVGAVLGRLAPLPTRTRGWQDYTRQGEGCQPVWSWDGARYISLRTTCTTAAAAPPPQSATPAAAPGVDRNAALRAAGMTQKGGRWVGCGDSPAEIEIRDLNDDGRPDALVTDGGLECYGNTGAGFYIVTKEASGAWKLFFQSPGIPTFLPTRGAGGWPDIRNGGPGFCHAVLRWTGSDYNRIRWHAESPGACAGR